MQRYRSCLGNLSVSTCFPRYHLLIISVQPVELQSLCPRPFTSVVHTIYGLKVKVPVFKLNGDQTVCIHAKLPKREEGEGRGGVRLFIS